MKRNSILSALLVAALLTGCSSTASSNTETESVTETTQDVADTQTTTPEKENETNTASGTQSSTASASSAALSDYFTDRDLEQEADASEIQDFILNNNEHFTISTAGVYELSGSYSNTTVIVDAGDDDKVQLVLNGLTIDNADFPAIYVKNADKVFVTSKGSNSLSVSSAFTSDGDTNTDAVIFSRDDLVLNGTGSLTINSTDNGISGKDDIKITGGSLYISSVADSVEANEGIYIADGEISIDSGKDAFNAGTDDDLTTGEIIIFGGNFDLVASDDGIQATTDLIVEDGSFTIQAAEGMESTHLVINGGTIDIKASDDGINAAQKATGISPSIEINGGDLTIVMGAGDTDAVDSNGDLYIRGGNINITAQSAFDYDGRGEKTGGTIYVNGSEMTTLTNSMMGGGRGQMGGTMGGRRNR